jgi:3D (Asp-Asp-Asp) domain-containing protein
MVLAAVVVVGGSLALAFALPAAGDPRHDVRPAAAPATAAARVQATITSLAAREQALDTAAERATIQLQIARRTLVVARRNLAHRLRTLYETGQAEPLEVLLGATSLSAAMNGLDSLRRSADQDRAWITEAQALRRQTERLRLSIAARRLAVAHLRESAEAAAAAVVAVQAPAPPAARQVAARTTPQPRTVDAPPAQPALGRTLTLVASAYALPGFTATGTPVAYGVVAVDPAVIPLGTHFTIPGYGDAVAADTGSAIRGTRIDVWLPTVERARAWGTRTVTVTIPRR